MFGFFNAFEVGAAGSAHSGMTVRVSGELVGAGRVVEGKTERGEKGRPPWLRPRRGPLDWGVCDNQSSYPVAVRVKPFIEKRGGDGGRWGRRDHLRKGGEDTIPICLVPVGRGGRGSEAGRIKCNHNRDMVGASRGQGGVPRGEGWHQVPVGEGKVQDRRP